MSQWQLAAIVLIVALVPPTLVCLHRGETHALVAMELAGTLLIAALLVLTEAVARQPFVDLALTFAFVSVVGGLTFARLMERDL